MGIDACIYLKTTDGEEPHLVDFLPPGVGIHPISEFAGATHEVDIGCRYYAPWYERGSWPRIAAVLMTVLAAPNVETVWYSGDDDPEPRVLTMKRFRHITEHYIRREM